MVKVWRNWYASRGGRLALAAISTGLVVFSPAGWALNSWLAGGRSMFCGGELREVSRFCPKCGRPVS